MKKSIKLFVILLLVFCFILTSCQSNNKLSKNNPVTLILWHNFGGQMQSTMDNLIDEFNATVGKEEGIIISVESISGSESIQDKLSLIASDEPGAPDMPDITTCYPQTAEILLKKNLIAPLDKQFTKKELDEYIPRFIDEGKLSDDKLYVFPFAKSTEVLFVNKTLFDKFASETDVTLDDLSTFEGIEQASYKYYEWTDSKTPYIKNDGKTFFTVDSPFNIAQVGMEQMGSSIWNDEKLNLQNKEFNRIMEFLCKPAVVGSYAIYDGYSSDLSKTGSIVCSTGSTAGILFYGDEIIYPDNTTEKVEYTILPYPTFENGKKIAIQRGSGMIVSATEPKKELAASIFLKWFTEPAQNMKFVASTGYLPVTKEAFTDSMDREIEKNDNKNIKKLLKTAIKIQIEYDFYIPPVFDSFNQTKDNFEKDLFSLTTECNKKYLEFINTNSCDEAYTKATSDLIKDFIEKLK